ncbi:hypothetical protein PoB_000243000 [Plakobranchus ocellatus]|uniref:Histone H2A n=1 Tax=Plakobranchus ocellatus TaxID=259542 RepID=A0AAV3XZN7_9GAST|nr:hypothetical protein PoB_000243000 [Plakobranchus ocellatus]
MKTRRFQAFLPSVRPGGRAGKARIGHGKISANLKTLGALMARLKLATQRRLQISGRFAVDLAVDLVTKINDVGSTMKTIIFCSYAHSTAKSERLRL